MTRLATQLAAIDRLNLGCGDERPAGWLNIGRFRGEIPYGRVVERRGTLLLDWDLTQPLPLAEGSLRYVYASHFIEHLSFEEGLALMRHCRDWLRPGGRLRLAFPDLELWVERYQADDRGFFERFRRLHLKGDDGLFTTKGEIFNAHMRSWGHRWSYDRESIAHLLGLAGFDTVASRGLHASALPDIAALEPASEERTLETAYVEAVR